MCRDMESFSQQDKKSCMRTDRGTGNKLGHINKPCEEAKEERWEDVRSKRMQDSVKDKEVGEVMKGIRQAPPAQDPPTIRARDVQVLVKAPGFSQ